MRQVRLDEDDRDADLPLQRVKVGGHVVLFVANVDHDLRTGG